MKQTEIMHIKLTHIKDEILYIDAELEIKTIDNVSFYSISITSDNDNKKHEMMLVRPEQIDYMYKTIQIQIDFDKEAII